MVSTVAVRESITTGALSVVLFLTHLVAAAGLGRLGAGGPRETGIVATGWSWPALSTGWLVVGAALPDVVDKPLGLLEVTTLFHSIGHSGLLLPATVLLALRGRRGAAIAVGWASHLLLDAVHVGINGRPSDALFLGWPVVVPPTPPAIPPGEFVWFYLGTPSSYVEVVLWVAVGALVVRSLRSSRDRGEES